MDKQFKKFAIVVKDNRGIIPTTGFVRSATSEESARKMGEAIASRAAGGSHFRMQFTTGTVVRQASCMREAEELSLLMYKRANEGSDSGYICQIEPVEPFAISAQEVVGDEEEMRDDVRLAMKQSMRTSQPVAVLGHLICCDADGYDWAAVDEETDEDAFQGDGDEMEEYLIQTVTLPQEVEVWK